MVVEQKGNIWDYNHIVIPTNGIVKANGELVMGAGLALECAKRYPKSPIYFGRAVRGNGNHCFIYVPLLAPPFLRIYSFPTKNHFKDKSDISLIEQSAKEMKQALDSRRELFKSIKSYKEPTIYLPRVGCGLGGLDWESEVKPILDKYLDDRFIVLS